MKPIKSKTFLIRTFLFTLSITLICFGFFVGGHEVSFFPSLVPNTTGVEMGLSLDTAMIPLRFLCFFFSFLFLYLLFEFYAFKSAFYASMALALTPLLLHGLSDLLIAFALDPENSRQDAVLAEVLSFKWVETLNFSIGIIASLTATFFIAPLIKIMTKNYLMFIRYPIAGGAGLLVFVAAFLFTHPTLTTTSDNFVLRSVIPLSQFASLLIASIIPLYLLRLFLGIFRGRLSNEASLQQKGTFKTNEPQHDLASQEFEEEVNVDEQDSEDVDDEENQTEDEDNESEEPTLSQKIRFKQQPQG